MGSHFTVVYDACVLYPAPLRDFLMRLALTDLYRARWTEMIHDEWIRNVLRQRPDLKPEDLDRTRVLMNAHVRDSLVTGFEHLIPSIALPDADDRQWHDDQAVRKLDQRRADDGESGTEQGGGEG